MKEEQILFPYITNLDAAIDNQSPAPHAFFGTVQNPVRMMNIEHDTAGDLLREMREITDNYAVPAEACMSYQALYQALIDLEADLHQHIHLENNILFPQAITAEREFVGAV